MRALLQHDAEWRVSSETFGVENMKSPSIRGSLPSSQLAKTGRTPSKTTSTTLLRGNLIVISTKDLPSSLNSVCLLPNLSIHTSVQFSHTSAKRVACSTTTVVLFPKLAANSTFHFEDNKLQVITKIVDYELQPGQSHEGVWHVEGMSHEEIVLTCLYILDRDDDTQRRQSRV